MKITVIGAGAIGGLIAAYLTKANVDVTLIGRKDQVEVLKAKGLSIKGVRGDEVIQVKVLTQMNSPSDVVIFATKTQDIEEAYQHNNAYLDTGFVLTTQNGVQADNILSVHFDRIRQLTSIVMFGATYISEGEIVFNFEGDWIIGRPFTPLDPSAHRIGDVLGKAFKILLSPRILGQKYLKLFVNFNNCIPALIGKSMQETFADLDLCRLSIQLLREGIGIMKESEIEIESIPNFPKERILNLTTMPIDQAAVILNKSLTSLSDKPLYGSILQSILRKKESEIEFINGEIVQLASNIRMDSSLNTRVVAMVHEVERTGTFFSVNQVKDAFNLKAETKL